METASLNTSDRLMTPAVFADPSEAQISLNAFLDRFPVMQRGTAPAIRQTASHLVFGFRQLPLVLNVR